LEIELTETAIMDQRKQALAMLDELAETGVRLAIDDFGTGHSSLAYLQRLPAHVMKIDQTFVRDLHETGPQFALLEMMVGLAHRLGFRVVAEGVETREVAAILTKVGCEEGQGFLFSRPIDAADFSRWFAEQERGASWGQCRG
jgi:EAL domain-containing protein (putative c-di-GMP-specific phosphodiesterase class I)